MCLESGARPRRAARLLPALSLPSCPETDLPSRPETDLPSRPLPARCSLPEIFTFDTEPPQQPQRRPTGRARRPRRVMYPAKVKRYLPPPDTNRALRWLYTLCLVVLAQICCEEELPAAAMGALPAADAMGALPAGDAMGALPAGDAMGALPAGDAMGALPAGDAMGALPAGDAMGALPAADAMGALPAAPFTDMSGLEMPSIILGALPAAPAGNQSAAPSDNLGALSAAPSLFKDFTPAAPSFNKSTAALGVPPSITDTRPPLLPAAPAHNLVCYILLSSCKA